jgi:nucleoside-diphosphate kinase
MEAEVNMEKTFVMLKPSAVTRGIVGNILTRIENKGLKIVAMQMVVVTREKAEKLYAVHKGKSFYESLIEYVTSAPVVALVVEGDDAVATVRKLIGNTNPKEAQSGTIRGDMAITTTKNLIHASDSVENAKCEMAIFFTIEDIATYKRADENWLY